MVQRTLQSSRVSGQDNPMPHLQLWRTFYKSRPLSNGLHIFLQPAHPIRRTCIPTSIVILLISRTTECHARWYRQGSRPMTRRKVGDLAWNSRVRVRWWETWAWQCEELKLKDALDGWCHWEDGGVKSVWRARSRPHLWPQSDAQDCLTPLSTHWHRSWHTGQNNM